VCTKAKTMFENIFFLYAIHQAYAGFGCVFG